MLTIGGELSGISLHEVTNIHLLPADAPIDRRCNVRKFKIQVEPNRVPGSTSSRYGRTRQFPVCLSGANLKPEVILYGSRMVPPPLERSNRTAVPLRTSPFFGL